MPHLEWLTRKHDLKASRAAPYRILEPVSSHGDETAENMLIQGENLDALKAILPRFAGKIRCIYIDPPYNTRSAFEHYDDNMEHTVWLSMMYPRLELLRDLLAEDGSIWVSIDDNEAHYLKVIMDEIFGRKNFMANVLWQKRTSPDARLMISDAHDHIFVYSKNTEKIKGNFNKIHINNENKYKNPDNDTRGPWVSTDFTAQGYRPNQMYTITTPSGKQYTPPQGRCWSNLESVFKALVDDHRIWFGKKGSSRPRIKNFQNESEGIAPWTWWENKEAGHNQEAKKEIIKLSSNIVEIFDTPKPERLLHRILHIATNPGDWVLDSFLGSGTTAAVAHKTGRRYIGVEIGDHAQTHCIPRLCKVIDGEQGGISETVHWKGGGGFRFFRLGDPVFDDTGRIRPDVAFAQLAAHVWFCETGRAWNTPAILSPLLGVNEGVAYYLLYNGILKDRSPGGGNTLTLLTLNHLPPHDGPKIIYAMRATIGAERLKDWKIVFRHIPFDVRRG